VTGQPARGAPRVLLLTDRYLPEVGGSFTWFHNVYTRHPAGSVWILTNSYPHAGAVDRAHPELHMMRTRLRRYPFLKPESLVMYLKMLLLSVWAILRYRIQIVHAGKNLPEGFVAHLVRRYLGVPYVVYAHGEEITLRARDPKQRPRLATIYGNAAAVIANSRFTRGLIQDLDVEERRIVVISPGVDPETFRPEAADPRFRSKLGFDGKLVLLTVGRLQRRKGQDRVIEALPLILREVPHLVYVIAGDGEEEAALRALAAERGVSSAVQFLGRVPQEDLPRLYNLADIVIMANRMMPSGDVEGFGIVFVEAGACAKPVIAGASGGTADAVHDGLNGLRVEGGCVDAIARAVVRLAADPELRRRMGEAGRQLVTAGYTWEAITGRIRKLSEAIILASGPAREVASAGQNTGR
jgi:phosphatidyl-myo-inositol dimannoside synthase